MRKIFFAATLAFAPLGAAAAQAGTGTAATGTRGNTTGAVEAASKPGGTAGALPNSGRADSASRADSATGSAPRDSTRRPRKRGSGRNRVGAARGVDSTAASTPPTPGSGAPSGAATPSGAPPR